MKTYLVRTRDDQVLIGLFCARSLKALADLIDSVFDARQCEYLELRENEGLFVEAHFLTTQPAADEPEQVYLVHPDDPILSQGAELGLDEPAVEIDGEEPEPADVVRAIAEELEELASDPERLEQALLETSLMEDQIPPVLEPTEALHNRFQQALRNGEWRPIIGTNAQPDTEPKGEQKPIDDVFARLPEQLMDREVFARRLKQGSLHPAMIMRSNPHRLH